MTVSSSGSKGRGRSNGGRHYRDDHRPGSHGSRGRSYHADRNKAKDPIPKPRGGFRPRRDERPNSNANLAGPSNSKSDTSSSGEVKSKVHPHSSVLVDSQSPRPQSAGEDHLDLDKKCDSDRDVKISDELEKNDSKQHSRGYKERPEQNRRTEDRDRRNKPYTEPTHVNGAIDKNTRVHDRKLDTDSSIVTELTVEASKPRDSMEGLSRGGSARGHSGRGRWGGKGRGRGRGRGAPSGLSGRREEQTHSNARAPPGFKSQSRSPRPSNAQSGKNPPPGFSNNHS